MGGAIAHQLGLSRNTVRKYLQAPEIPQPAPRPHRASKLAPYEAYVLAAPRGGGDKLAPSCSASSGPKATPGGHTILREVHPLRRPSSRATVRFETDPGEQAQVD